MIGENNHSSLSGLAVYGCTYTFDDYQEYNIKDLEVKECVILACKHPLNNVHSYDRNGYM